MINIHDGNTVGNVHPKRELSRWYMDNALLSLGEAAAISSIASGPVSVTGNLSAERLLAKSAVPAKA